MFKNSNTLESSKQFNQLSFQQVDIKHIKGVKGMADGLHYKEIYIFAKQKVTEYAQSVGWARLTGQ